MSQKITNMRLLYKVAFLNFFQEDQIRSDPVIGSQIQRIPSARRIGSAFTAFEFSRGFDVIVDKKNNKVRRRHSSNVDASLFVIRDVNLSFLTLWKHRQDLS